MLSNTPTSYGTLARAFHWLVALLILSAIALGLYGESLPRNAETIDTLKTLYSAHKTIGVAAFFTALARILWALVQPRPTPLHPERRLETFGAELVHWALYGAMLVMPASGWISHAAQAGFAPILWPFGQTLPFVPQSDAVSHGAEIVHKLSALVLYAALALHVLGALKHVVIDRDATLARMTRGTAAGPGKADHSALAPLLAVMIWAAVISFALLVPLPDEEGAAPTAVATAPATPSAAAPASTAGNWQVTQGTLGFTVKQMGAEVSGSLPNWTADIAYDEATGTGTVTVTIDTTTLVLGSVSDQAKGADFFDTAAHPSATFTAAIARTEGTAHTATGTLTLRGTEVPVVLPFTLTIEGDTATMSGQTTLDRRAFGMGASYPDEATVGFNVGVQIALTATRKD